MGKLNPGRKTALKALISSAKGTHIEYTLSESTCDTRDLALAWFIVYGVLRHQGQLDAMLEPFCKGKWKKIEDVPKNALRIGLFESIFSRTPERAAVSQAVELVKRSGHKSASGLVNAVLRKSIKAEVPPGILNVPEWLREHFVGYENILIEQPPVNIATKSLERPPGIECDEIKLSDDTIEGVFRVNQSTNDLKSWPGFERGEWWVMDPAAALVVDLGVEALGNPSQFTALDVCAAPGGKTWRLMSKGADIFACDISEKRLMKFNENALRLGFKPNTYKWDWSKKPLNKVPKCDLVLVDAPCTGTGVMRRHPEIRWRREQSELGQITENQYNILKNSADLVSDSGVLVYSVCSILPEEGINVVENLEGWEIMNRRKTFPPDSKEDGFQIYILKKQGLI